MVPMIAALEKADLIARSAMDGRSQALNLTESGAARLEAAKNCIEAHERHFQSKFTMDENNFLIGFMHKISSRSD
jgi:DNA-binding MarR family transcriptional regulator